MPPRKLSVAVTGPTGEIGKSFVRALERSREIGEIRGMARRAFDPSGLGWRRTEYVQGDILDVGAVAKLVEGADVVVHLAFIIFGGREEAREVNLRGSRNVFEASVAAGAKRLVYTSSVAAYGFHSDNPQPLSEQTQPRGSESFYYSAQKAELERALSDELEGTPTEAYVFRPSIVAGPEAPALIANLPYVQLSQALPGPVRRALAAIPTPPPVLPEFGVPIQLVHADDVATALRAGVLGRGEPGIFNLAGGGEVTIAQIAEELGWRSVPIPHEALSATAEVLDRLPLTPPKAEWIQAMRTPMIMDTTRARRLLRWRPRKDALTTLRETIAGARRSGLLG